MSGESFIYFNGQFWLGVFWEEKDGVVVRVGKYIFGQEPKASDIDHWLSKGAPGLIMCEVSAQESDEDRTTLAIFPQRKSPKRMLREVKREQEKGAQETKAVRVMREVIEANKSVVKKMTKAQREEAKERKFALRAKKKAKSRGR